MPNLVDVTYAQTGESTATDALGMREMQRKSSPSATASIC